MMVRHTPPLKKHPQRTVPSPYDIMPDIDIQVNGVAKLLRGLKAHKVIGPDEVPARLLKEAADQLAPILTTVFRASYIQSTTPVEWRSANVVPILKKGITLQQQITDRCRLSQYVAK